MDTYTFPVSLSVALLIMYMYIHLLGQSVLYNCMRAQLVIEKHVSVLLSQMLHVGIDRGWLHAALTNMATRCERG